MGNDPFSTIFEGWIITGSKNEVHQRIKELKSNTKRELYTGGLRGRINVAAKPLADNSKLVVDQEILSTYCKNLFINVIKEL